MTFSPLTTPPSIVHLARVLQTAGREPLACRPVAEQRAKGVRESRLVAGVDGQRGRTGYLAERGRAGGNDGRAARHRLERGQAVALVEGGIDERVGTAIRRCEMGIVDVANEANAIADGRGFVRFAHRCRLPAGRAGDHQIVGQAIALHGDLERPDEAWKILARLHGADEKRVRGRQAMTLAKGAHVPTVRRRQVRTDALADHTHLAAYPRIARHKPFAGV